MVGKVIQRKYRILEEIGMGTVSTVYLARNLATNDMVALKREIHFFDSKLLCLVSEFRFGPLYASAEQNHLRFIHLFTFLYC